jgi:hypothetical protein
MRRSGNRTDCLCGSKDHDDQDDAQALLSCATALIEHLQLVITKMKRERFGPRSERSQRLLDQVGLLKELVVAAGEDGKISDGFEQTGQAQPT